MAGYLDVHSLRASRAAECCRAVARRESSESGRYELRKRRSALVFCRGSFAVPWLNYALRFREKTPADQLTFTLPPRSSSLESISSHRLRPPRRLCFASSATPARLCACTLSSVANTSRSVVTRRARVVFTSKCVVMTAALLSGGMCARGFFVAGFYRVRLAIL